MRSIFHRLGAIGICAALLFLGSALAAQPVPSLERGVKPDKLYQFGDLDSVNVMNGNLLVRLPIGSSYPVGGGLSYGLSLIYNSKAWDFQEASFQGNIYGQAIPDRLSNAGMGWSVTLGRLLSPTDVFNDNHPWQWTCIGPDGAQHLFYQGLQTVGPVGVDPCTSTCYTRDGSYVRMSVSSSTERVIETPDGIRRFFQLFPLDAFTTEWRLTEIRDRFDDGLIDVMISYSADGNTWTITDKHGRQQRVFFGSDASGRYKRLLQRIELTAFGVNADPAVYTFTYVPQQVISVPCGSTLPNWNSVSVPLLQTVSLPDGTSFGMSYYAPSSPDTCHAPGLLSDLVLPIRGKLHYTYRQHVLPIKGCSFRSWHSSTAGIATRQFIDAAGQDAGTWTYSSQLSPSPWASTSYVCDDHSQPFRPPSEELQVTVVTPLKNKTVHYFSVFPGTEFPSTTAFDQRDYGLPFSKLPLADGTGTRFLSTQVFQCDVAGANCAPARATYVRYERDADSRCDLTTGPGPDCLDTNRRPASERTVYLDDNHFADVDSSDFDNFGHYRTVATNGDFPGGGNQRSTFTNYNQGNVLPGSAWVLGTFTEQRVSEGAGSAKVQFCFDPDTGYLSRQRTYGTGTSPATNDVLLVNTPDAAGNTVRQEWFGGDDANQALSLATDLCNLGLPTTNAYRLDQSYQYGVVQTAQYKDAAGNAGGTLAFKSIDQDIDLNTGLVAVSRDPAGIATNFSYDAMGRLLAAKPQTPGEAWDQTTYVNATAGNQARIEVSRCSPANTSFCTSLTQSQTEFDDFGRVAKERRLMADGTWSKRVTTYDLEGNKASLSELQPDTVADTAVKKTTFSGYDVFGRPGTITPADGALHAVTLTYAGIRSETRTFKVGTGTLNANGNVPETSVSVTRIHDRQGRLWRVNEPSGPGGGAVISEYTYDVGNRLAIAKTTAPEATQFRFFNYDNRGFLITEIHPEKGGAPVKYSKYDPLGHAGRIEDVIGGPNDLSFFYDRAGRLTSVWETGSTGRQLKSFLYASGNGPANFKNGKLEQAKRHNYVALGTTAFDVELTQTYTYGGVNGRVSKRDTQLATNGTPGESFTQGFTWNALGEVSSIDYPRCTNTGCQQLFQDVPVGAPNKREIEAIYPGVTAGCNTSPLQYCPGDSITRGQMSVYLLRAKEGPAYVPPPCTGIFQDVPCGSNPFAPWVEEMSRRGITGGCSVTPRNFCPNEPVNNAQMAVFLITSLGVSPPACTSAPFADVPCTAFAAAFIAEEARRQITFGCGGGNFCPSAVVTRGDMAGLVVRAFAIPLRFDPNTQRNLQLAYTNGFLTGVPGYASTITYNANGLINQVAHSNGVTDTQSVDTTNWLARPLSVSTSGAGTNWSTGTYKYDGAGNITKMGTDWFQYDPVSRLVRGVVHDGLMGGGNEKQQAYTFDTYGNITGITTTAGGSSQSRQTPTDPGTNRLSGAATYDAAGNLTSWNGASYQYDPFNKMWRMQNGGEEWLYLYTADDERLWSYKTDGTLSRWTLRDLEGKPLREYNTVNSALWSIASDYIYRDGHLLAAETATGPHHFHLDHLGTPRLITNAAAQKVAYHVYYPFGEEATAFNQDTERLKFTGHERDLASLAGAGDDLDYMHARFCSPITSHFLSIDPSSKSQEPRAPQSWNRFTYAQDNPLKYIDPTGAKFICPKQGCPGFGEPKTFWQWLKKGLHEASILPGPMALEVGAEVVVEEVATELVSNGAAKAVAPSSRVLGKALEATGEVRPAGAAVHHIVAGSAKAAAPARGVLQDLEVGINEAENGVFLPANTSSPNLTGAAVHSRVHTNLYYQEVNTLLQKAGSQEEAIEFLEVIRSALLSGGFP